MCVCVHQIDIISNGIIEIPFLFLLDKKKLLICNVIMALLCKNIEYSQRDGSTQQILQFQLKINL